MYRSELHPRDKDRKALLSGTYLLFWSVTTAKVLNLQMVCSWAFPQNSLEGYALEEKDSTALCFLFFFMAVNVAEDIFVR